MATSLPRVAPTHDLPLLDLPALDLATPVTVARAFVRELERFGIEQVFGIPGGACSPLDDALLDSRIRMITCQHEALAAYMAIGYHRATGRPGVVIVTSGPGVLNTAPALAAARLDDDGLVVIAGDVMRQNADRGALQDGGARGLQLDAAMGALAGEAETVRHAFQAQARLGQALFRAAATPASPTVLSVPVDVLRAQASPCAVFGAPAPVPAAGEEALEAAVSVLSRVRQGLVWLGVGARSLGEALVPALERLGWPVITDSEGRGVISDEHPLRVGCFGVGDDGAAHAWLTRHPPGAILAIGARFDDTTTNGYAAELHQPRLVQIDHSALRLARGLPAAVAIHADIPSTVAAIAARMPGASVSIPRRPVAVALPLQNTPFDPRAVVVALQRCFPADTTFTSDIGNHLLATLTRLRVRRAGQLHISQGLGGMGSGIGMAFGLAAAGVRPVVGICGDGGALMAGNDVATCVKYRLPVVLAIFHDGHLGMVHHGVTRIYGRSDPYALPPVDFVAWARALGADAMRIESEADLQAAAGRELRGPLVLEIPIDPAIRLENPREKVFAFPEAT
ncbi:thiamine pyrophosphate-binding protein [Nannocystis sp. RBIL2]|uniref:thiamine pyrophosphate-binding protein n=1 Tax=Nannocystis sp. RBIL2 TaxID=2996788 RepID=UPI00226F31CC|nr:thiamine pyrophosphate-binding protein [Nannocystis sp. RBIL2]MCY1065227.1 thiamine pyrophosphate-binding protein [Nannocystis sp. RBIL2]